jgi:predicted Zn-dependent peptidase
VYAVAFFSGNDALSGTHGYLRSIGSDLHTDCAMHHCVVSGSALTIGLASTIDRVRAQLEPTSFTPRGLHYKKDDLIEARSSLAEHPIVVERAVLGALAGGHPYAEHQGATAEQIGRVTETQLEEFHGRLRRSPRVVTFAGAITHDQAERLARSMLVPLGPSRAAAKPPPAPEPQGAQLIIRRRAEAPVAWIAAALVGPGLRTSHGPGFRAMMPILAAEVNARARQAHGETYSAPVGVQSYPAAQIGWMVTEVPQRRAGAMVRAMREALANVANGKATAFARARAQQDLERAFELQTSQGRASVACDTFKLWGARGEPRVSPDEIVNAARLYAKPDAATFAVMGDVDTIKASLTEADVELPITIER